MWLRLAYAVLVGGACLLVKRLTDEAGDSKKRWEEAREAHESLIENYEKQIQAALNASITSLQYAELIELHHASQCVANNAYELYKDAQTAICKIGETLKNAKEARNKLYPHMKNPNASYEERQRIREEFNSYGYVRESLFPEFNDLKAQKETFYSKLKDFNNKTRSLKHTIRDNCGQKGYDWYERLEERTRSRKWS